MTPRIRETYDKEVVPAMMKEFGYKNRMEVPRLTRIVINMGLGRAVAEPKMMESATKELARIAGQKPVVTKAKKAIANFKLRRGLPIGCMVTLRQRHMYEFFDRLCNVALARVRDFKGISGKAFDKRGNYTLGIREHTIFPEVDIDKVDKPLGMNVTFITTAHTDAEAKSLLGHLGMPFRKN